MARVVSSAVRVCAFDRRRVALVTHAVDGGVGSMVRFLAQVLEESGLYEPEIILVATSVRDPASVRLLKPGTWLRGPRMIPGEFGSLPCNHVGAFLSELEFLRYRPRRILNQLLSRYDLIQVVAGTPAWAGVALAVDRPVCLFAATTAAQERVSRLRGSVGWRRLWLQAMTRITSRIERSVISAVDCVFAESSYTYSLLAPWRGMGRMVIAPPGVDTSFFVPAAAFRPGGHIIAVGRLADPRKNVGLLLRAYRQLRDSLPLAPRLVFVGHTPLQPADEALLGDLELTAHVEVHVNVAPEALRALYRGASLFVLSSDEEGLGIVILEAMASGLPVVSTDCGGPRTAVEPGETGLLTPVGDVQALAGAMRALLADPLHCQRMGRAGRNLIERRFSLAAAGRIYLDEYHVLLSGEG